MSMAYLQNLATTANTLVSLWNETETREQFDSVNELHYAWLRAVDSLPEQFPQLFRENRMRLYEACADCGLRIQIGES